MKVIPTKIEGLLLIEELSLDDVKSFPLRGMKLSQWRDCGEMGAAMFTRTKLSYGNVRGLHFQRGLHAQARFVRALKGEIFDVVLDMRKDSETFGQHVRVPLAAGDRRGVLIPAGCAHGFSVTSPEAEVGIWWDGKFHASACGGVSLRDKYLNIDWGIPPKEQMISSSDMRNPLFLKLFSSRRPRIKGELNFR